MGGRGHGGRRALALALSERVLRPMVGTIIFIMLGVYLWRRRRGSGELPRAVLPAGQRVSVRRWRTPPVRNEPVSFGMRLPKEQFLGRRLVSS